MTSTLPPLMPGSPSARAVYRIMSGARVTTVHAGPYPDARVALVGETIGSLATRLTAEKGVGVLVPAWSTWAATEARTQLAAVLERIGVPAASRVDLTDSGHDSLLVTSGLPTRCLVVDIVATDRLRWPTRRVDLLILNDDWTLGSDRSDLLVEASQILHVRDSEPEPMFRRVRAKGTRPERDRWGAVPLDVVLAGSR